MTNEQRYELIEMIWASTSLINAEDANQTGDGIGNYYFDDRKGVTYTISNKPDGGAVISCQSYGILTKELPLTEARIKRLDRLLVAEAIKVSEYINELVMNTVLGELDD